MTTSKKVLLAVAAFVLAGAGWLYFSRPTALVARATGGTAYKLVPGSVAVLAKFEMNLKSEVGGRVVRSELDPGNPVATGAVLAQLDTGGLELEIERIRNEAEAAKQRIKIGSSLPTELQNAREELENLERMTRAGNYPEAELTKRRRAVRQIEQRLEHEKVNNHQQLQGYEIALKVNQRHLDQMTITAPFDGVVAEVYARPGDLIGANDPIAKIISTDRIVEARISEENFADLRIGQKARVRLISYGAEEFAATVVKLLPTSDPQTQRYVVHLEVGIDPARLVPGITGEVTIVVGERQARANVPRRALFGDNLFVVRGGRVEQRKVEVGFTSLTTVEVLKGVEPGEEVIIDEIDRFRPGTRVRPKLVTAD